MLSKNFDGIKLFEKKIWLASPTMHDKELEWVQEAIRVNWVKTAGDNINNLEKACAQYIGCKCMESVCLAVPQHFTSRSSSVGKSFMVNLSIMGA